LSDFGEDFLDLLLIGDIALVPLRLAAVFADFAYGLFSAVLIDLENVDGRAGFGEAQPN